MSKLSEQTGVDWKIGGGNSLIDNPINIDWGTLGFGAKDDDTGGVSSQSGEQASQIATEMYSETGPLREDILARSEAFMGEGQFDPTQSALYKPGRESVETQYLQSNELARQNLPAGGSLNQALSENVRERGSGLTSLEGAITQDEYNKAYGLATGVPALSLSTLTSLAGSEMEASAANQAAKTGLLGEFGGSLGYLFGSKG